MGSGSVLQMLLQLSAAWATLSLCPSGASLVLIVVINASLFPFVLLRIFWTAVLGMLSLSNVFYLKHCIFSCFHVPVNPQLPICLKDELEYKTFRQDLK